MKLIPKYKHAGTLNKEWVKDRDINGNWGYRNIKTGQFRTTLPNSQEEKKQEQTKRNNAVLKTYSANKARFDESYESRRRNHSDETVKKVISKPVITVDSDGNANTGYSTQLAPGEDSAQLNTFIEEQIPIVKGFRLVTGLGKLVLSKLGSNEVSHWARNSLVNEAAGDIASTVRAAIGDNQTITTGAYPITGAETMRPNPFTGFWDNIRYQEQPQGITSLSYFKPTKKAWATGNGEGNEATSYFFKKSPDQQFELVKDWEPGNYSIHFKTDREALSYGDKMQLFAKVADEIPEGGAISTWGTISKGGVHGINRFGSDFGFQRIGTRQLTLKGTEKPISVGIYRKPNPRGFYSIGTPGYPYLYDPVTKQWTTSTISQLLKSGKQEFIDWMNNPTYRKAAEANQAEAESMGLAYTPTYEKTEYLHPQNTTVKNIGSSSLGGTTDRSGDIVINVQTAQNPKDVMAHEFGHANWHGNVSESTMANTEQGKKEWQYLKFKAGQVFKPNSWYSDRFDLNSHGPEAVMNARDYGKEIGLEIGQEYPGYEKALELINSNNNGFKSGLKNMFYLDKEHMPYVWKALTGTQFAIPAVGFSLPFLNNNN